MTINVGDIKTLLRNKEMRDRIELKEVQDNTELTKSKLQTSELYLQKLSFHIDKSTKLLEIIERDEKNTKQFKEIHAHLFEQTAGDKQ